MKLHVLQLIIAIFKCITVYTSQAKKNIIVFVVLKGTGNE